MTRFLLESDSTFTRNLALSRGHQFFPSRSSFSVASAVGIDTPRCNSGQSYAGAETAQLFSVEEYPLADGCAGTYQALDAMAQAVRGEIPPDYSGLNDPYIINFAQKLGSVRAMFDYAAHRVAYIHHPPHAQVVQDARRTIEIGSGDCVSKSVLLASLLASQGYQPYFIAQYPSDNTGFSHVYVAMIDEQGQELRLDPVASDKPMGWSQSLPMGGFELEWHIF